MQLRFKFKMGDHMILVIRPDNHTDFISIIKYMFFSLRFGKIQIFPLKFGEILIFF